MKRFNKLLLFGLQLLLLTGCVKEMYEDTSLISSDSAPEKLGALMQITQDNSGLVTITPSGEGLAYSLVFFGDNNPAPERVLPGQSIQHKYAEGNYNVRIRGVSLTGQTEETTQALTVSFRKPENLQVNVAVDGADKFKVNVDAKADYETFFQVYWGDVANEVPQNFNEGTVVSHTYNRTGKFTVRVVALSGGAATAEYTKEVEIVNPILLPIDFEDVNRSYTFINFDGGNASVINNPFKSGINTSNRVGRMIKAAGQPWGGAVLPLGAPIDFSANKFVKVKVYSPRVGAKMLFKVENAADGSIAYEKEVATTVANAWEELTFDFTAINTANSYSNIVLIFELGTVGDGSNNFTFYFDDIRLANTATNAGMELPVEFESANIAYKFTDFGNAFGSVVANPAPGGSNGSAKVGKLLKASGAEVWAGSFFELSKPIDFSGTKKISMSVWSPRAGIVVKMKLENLADPSKNTEVDVTVPEANKWQDLVFDFSGANHSNTFQRVVVFFDFGNAGTNESFYFDNIKLSAAVETLSLPLTFESSALNYDFLNFDGGNVTVVNNPSATGINTSSKVARMIKGAGQPWGGAFITLNAPIDFSTRKTMQVKVFSPRVGAKLLLKVENLNDGGIAFEKEVTTTRAGEWELLSFDYSGINTANTYQKVVLIFDLGTVGNGSANFTYYFDDISLN